MSPESIGELPVGGIAPDADEWVFAPASGSGVDLVFGPLRVTPAAHACDLVFRIPGTAQLGAITEDAVGQILAEAHVRPARGVVLGTTEDTTGQVFAAPLRPSAVGVVLAVTEDAIAQVRVEASGIGGARIHATTEDSIAQVAAGYDPNVFRGPTVTGSPRHAESSSRRATLGTRWQQATRTSRQTESDWHQSRRVRTGSAGDAWVQRQTRATAAGASWAEAGQVSGSVGSRWHDPPQVSGRGSDRWGDAGARTWSVGSRWRYPPARRTASGVAWRVGDPRRLSRMVRFGVGAPRRRAWRILWRQGHGVAWAFGWPRPPERPPATRRPSTALVFRCRLPDWAPQALDLIFVRAGCPWATPPLHVFGRTYRVQNLLDIVRLPDRVPVPATAVRLALDRDDWTWSIDLELAGPEGLALISPLDGDPVAVETTINGFTWVTLIEEFASAQTFPTVRHSARGRSAAAVLAAPYALPRTVTSSETLSAGALLAGELQDTGWTLAYPEILPGLEDLSTDLADLLLTWLIPAGVYSYADKTRLEAIGLIASAIGARLVADRRDPTLWLAPRYPVPPWQWDAAGLLPVIPSAAIKAMQTRMEPRPAIHQVIVSGAHQGVVVTVRRTDTGTFQTAPMIVDRLLTHSLAGLERGRNELASYGKQARVTLEIPLTLDTGLLEPGTLVTVGEGASAWRGLVTGCSVQGTLGQVSQTLEIERHYP